MNELKDARAKQKDEEIKQISLFGKYLEAQRERFDYADTTQWIIDDKCDVDLIYLQDKVLEWLKSAKNDSQKKILNEMAISILRTSSYIDQMRTLNKHTVSKYVTKEKLLQSAHSEKRIIEIEKDREILQLKKQLEDAKKEIEFIQGNNS